ncbi:MAG: CinA family protein [Candidatus Limnocylindrales bacterium]
MALAGRVQTACLARSLTVSTAESCTGGLIGHVLTQVPGSSGYFLGGVISYHDAVKASQLGVPPETLAHHGAVSAQVALAMAAGARERLGTDLAVAVTGVAGPTGGSAEKPVGLTYVAVADAAGSEVERHVWGGDREANKVASVGAALELLLRRLDESRAA